MREPEVMPLDEFKALLPELADVLTDDHLLELRALEYRIADAIIDWWLRQREDEKSTDSHGTGT